MTERPEKWTNYTAFGFEMPGRSVGSDYKYGMNGQMKEGEVFEGFMSADFWGYDSRLGRRWELDPITYSWQSGYACFNNNPIFFSDPLGLEGEGGPKKGDVYNCGDGTTEVFDGTQYVSPSQYVSNLPGAQNRSFTMSQSVMADGAISMRIMEGLSHNQKAEIRMAGMMNAMSSNTMLGAGRMSADALYADPEMQSLYLQGQIAGDIASIAQGQTEIGVGAGMITVGEGMVVGGVIFAETGVGLIVAGGGEVVAAAGELVTLHGQAVTIVASAQLVKTTVLLAAVTTHNGNDAAAKSDGGGSGDGAETPVYKTKKAGLSGKEGAKDVPSWALGEKPYVTENGKKFAKRILDKKYGEGNYETGPATEYNQIKKWGDRAFEVIIKNTK